MKAVVVAVVLALLAALLSVSRGEQPAAPRQMAASVHVTEQGDGGAPIARSAVEPPAEQSAPPVGLVPEPVDSPLPSFPQPPDWTPTVSEFVEAGLTEQQAEVLVAGLEHLQKFAPTDEELAEAIQEGITLRIQSRIVLLMAPTLVDAIKAKKIATRWREWQSPRPGGALSTFVVGFDNRGVLTEFTFGARNPRGAVSLDIPPDMCDRQLLLLLESAANGKR